MTTSSPSRRRTSRSDPSAAQSGLLGVGAVVAVLVLLVGVPAALAIGVGWPLPRSVPSWSAITDTLNGDQPLDATTVWKVLAVVVWIAWAQLAAAVVIEAAAVVRGRTATIVPALGHMQTLVGPLLSAAAILLASATHQRPLPAATDLTAARTLALAATTPDRPEEAEQTAPPPAPLEPARAPTVVHTVIRGDTLWDLADRYAAPGGDVADIAGAVTRIFEANVGRPQADGGALTDASLLRPGWRLAIPATATATTVPAPATNGTVIVEPGDSLSSIAEEHLDDPDRYPEIFELNEGHPQPDGRTLTDPSLIHPGWHLTITAPPEPTPTTRTEPDLPPPAPRPEPETSDYHPQSTAPAVPHASTTPPSAATPEPATATPPEQPNGVADSDGDGSGDVHPAAGIGGLVLACGVGTLVIRNRRRRSAQRPIGGHLPPLPPDAAAAARVISSVDTDPVLATVAALRILGQRIAGRSHPPRPRVVHLWDARLEVALNRADNDAPSPWQALDGGRLWVADLAEAAQPGHDAELVDPLPGLVTLGRIGDGGFLLDIEGEGVCGLVGDTEAVNALARSMVREAATSPFTSIRQVGVVGIPDPAAGTVTFDDLASAVAAVAPTSRAMTDSLSASGAASTYHLRIGQSGESFAPWIVFIGIDAVTDDPAAFAELASFADGGGKGVGIVLVGDCPSGATPIVLTDGELKLPLLGLTCDPQALTAEEAASIDQLLEAADAAAVETAEPAPLTLFEPHTESAPPNYDHGCADQRDPDSKGTAAKSTEGVVVVRLTGDVSVDGAVLTPQQTAVVAWLSVAGPSSGDELRDAVWGRRPPTQERFLNLIHELRRALGAHRFPPALDGRYRLAGVPSDLDILVGSRDLRTLSNADLIEALAQVRGIPLGHDARHRRHYQWVDLGPHRHHLERVIGDAAHELARRALVAGRPHEARWAAEAGLLASPGHQTLTGDLIEALFADGDRTGAEQALRAFEANLETLGIDDPPEDLYRLFESSQAG